MHLVYESCKVTSLNVLFALTDILNQVLVDYSVQVCHLLFAHNS